MLLNCVSAKSGQAHPSPIGEGRADLPRASREAAGVSLVFMKRINTRIPPFSYGRRGVRGDEVTPIRRACRASVSRELPPGRRRR